jgi:ABC-type Fe3+/spermidine/putrescine transport system ATPase subunit
VPKLDILNVSKFYGDIAAVDDASFHVEDKEYVCVIGPSGCGKSTLIKCIAGIINPDQGNILVDGEPVQRVPIEDRRIGYVFQDIALFPHMTVRDNLAYGLVVRNAKADQVSRVTNEMLDLINMRERSKSVPRELSGGAQQKVAVGRAIATGSYLFLLDEPLGALDALVRAQLRYELKQLAKDLGLTVIHVTHDQEEALSIADRVIIMRKGRIVEIGKPAEIYLSPKNLFTENFVGETNLLEGTVVGVDGGFLVIAIGGRTVRILASIRNRDEKVIISIRPEFVALTRASGKSQNGWRGKIGQVAFLGSLNRYLVQIEEGIDLIVHVATASESDGGFEVGDEVDLTIEMKHILLFDCPTEGLEKEIALE